MSSENLGPLPLTSSFRIHKLISKGISHKEFHFKLQVNGDSIKENGDLNSNDENDPMDHSDTNNDDSSKDNDKDNGENKESSKTNNDSENNNSGNPKINNSSENINSKDTKPKIMLSGFVRSEYEELEGMVKDLGAEVTSQAKFATHLVMPNMGRTISFLCAISYVKFILKPAWIRQSHKEKKVLGMVF